MCEPASRTERLEKRLFAHCLDCDWDGELLHRAIIRVPFHDDSDYEASPLFCPECGHKATGSTIRLPSWYWKEFKKWLREPK
jgi:hypothetical protein